MLYHIYIYIIYVLYHIYTLYATYVFTDVLYDTYLCTLYTIYIHVYYILHVICIVSYTSMHTISVVYVYRDRCALGRDVTSHGPVSVGAAVCRYCPVRVTCIHVYNI